MLIVDSWLLSEAEIKEAKLSYLSSAIQSNSDNFTNWMIEKKFPLSKPHGSRITSPLCNAVLNDRFDLFIRLLEAGADAVEVFDNPSIIEYPTYLEYLLQRGFFPSSIETLLYSAIKEEQTEAVKILLRYGAKVHVTLQENVLFCYRVVTLQQVLHDCQNQVIKEMVQSQLDRNPSLQSDALFVCVNSANTLLKLENNW